MSKKSNKKKQESKEAPERKIDDPHAVNEGNVRYRAVFCGGDSFKFQMLKEDLHSLAGLNYAQEKAFEEFEMKVGKSVRKDYTWVIGAPSSNSNGEIDQTFTCENFFNDQRIHISDIVQSTLLEVDELQKEKKKWDNEKKQIGAKKKREDGKKTTVVRSETTTTSCEGCKELKTIVAQLEQSFTEQQQTIAYLLSAVNSVVLPMQKIHLRVLLHNMRAKVCTLLGHKTADINDWFAYLGGILDSPEQLETLQMGADIIRFVQTQAKAGKLNNAAHEAEQADIAKAVLAVQDDVRRSKWERVFFSVYGVAPSFPAPTLTTTIEEGGEIWV